jgi:hypothetical protein
VTLMYCLPFRSLAIINVILADYPALPGHLFIPIFYQTGKGINSIYSVKSK